MLTIWLYLFVGINLLIRLPVRIAIRYFKIESDKLYTIDYIARLVVGFCFVGMIASAMIAGEIDTGLAITCIVLFGGGLLFLSGVAVYSYIKEKRDNNKK